MFVVPRIVSLLRILCLVRCNGEALLAMQVLQTAEAGFIDTEEQDQTKRLGNYSEASGTAPRFEHPLSGLHRRTSLNLQGPWSEPTEQSSEMTSACRRLV